ncbi:hypothetical protein Syun_002780 [Stephania yunnanensis]|uniref:AB hydrolase-1 domain-containing protein n=1 Tax=Stephania yunnanensis TaxID=152371 RepID=A0AAP0LJA5_9MAGN
MTVENVIFFHGCLSSSSFWTETVFPNLSEVGNQKYRLFAVDLLGFGRSPKPWDCLYTLNEHVDMVQKSVLSPFNLESFHIVAHSMGCIIALAFAAKNVNSVKSITLIAPPYFPSLEEKASLNALNRLAQKRLWPPLLFGSAVMSWYEHVGRSVCFLICRNHRILEWAFKPLAGKRYFFVLQDLMRHTHHSAWHSMHNVICGGAKLVDRYLETLNNESGSPLTVIQGNKDQVVPMECSLNMKLKSPRTELLIIPNANHWNVIFGREQSFTSHLEKIWLSVAAENTSRKMSC